MTPEERALRRRLVKAHHPDRGGDPARFLEVLDALDRGQHPRVATTATTSRRVRRRRLLRRLQAWLPRGVPGARRYARL